MPSGTNRRDMEATTRLIYITVAELHAIIADAVRAYTPERMPEPKAEKTMEKTYYGIAGMAEVLHCSRAKAARMKAQGMLEGGYQQIGKGIIVKNPQALRDIAELSMRKSKKDDKTNS